MSNTFNLKDSAKIAAQMVAEEASLAALVSRDLQGLILEGARGRTVDIKVPAALIARTRDADDKTTALVMDELTESTVPVTLGTYAYSKVGLSAADLSYKLEDFSAQVLVPQVAAVVDYVEAAVASAITAVPETSSIAWDAANPVATFTQIRKALRENGVPATGLVAVVGTDVYAALLDAKAITDVSESGSTEALRNANVGNVRGITVIESTRVDNGLISAFHKAAVQLVVAAPANPQGAVKSGREVVKGFAVRHLMGYDGTVDVDYSTVSTFVGVKVMPLFRINRSGASGAVTRLDNGAIINVNTETAP